jgi:hypothetical protein
MDKVILGINKLSFIKKPEPTGLLKKIFLAIGVIILLFGIIQIINATKYSMVVNVKDGENILGINPLDESLDFGDLSRNNGMTRYVTLKNGGSASTYVSIWKFGEISDLIKVNEGSFILMPGDEKKISFEISVPNSAQTRKYSGWVWIFRLPSII